MMQIVTTAVALAVITPGQAFRRDDLEMGVVEPVAVFMKITGGRESFAGVEPTAGIR